MRTKATYCFLIVIKSNKLVTFNEWKGLPLDMRLINFRAIIG